MHGRNTYSDLRRLKESELTLSGVKMSVQISKVDILGHELNTWEVAPSEEKIEAVVNARAQTNVSKVRFCDIHSQFCTS